MQVPSTLTHPLAPLLPSLTCTPPQDRLLLGAYVQVVRFPLLSPLVRRTLTWVCNRGLVAAGLKDLSRPADVISVPQNLGPSFSPSPVGRCHWRELGSRRSARGGGVRTIRRGDVRKMGHPSEAVFHRRFSSVSDPFSLPHLRSHFLSSPSITLSLRFLSLSTALTATGLIWVRYSFVITPVNYSLAAVNCFVAATGFSSLYRAWEWVLFLSSLPSFLPFFSVSPFLFSWSFPSFTVFSHLLPLSPSSRGPPLLTPASPYSWTKKTPAEQAKIKAEYAAGQVKDAVVAKANDAVTAIKA
jgi:hypothetical protein